jgi:magnesium transporter
MTVVAAYLYRNGERVREVEIDERVSSPRDRSEFVWIGICDPTAEEMRSLQEKYRLHRLVVEDALKADQLPKIDIYGDQLFVVARTAQLEDDQIVYARRRSLSAAAILSASVTARRAPTNNCAPSSRPR